MTDKEYIEILKDINAKDAEIIEKLLWFKHDEYVKCADGSRIKVEVEACYWPDHDDIAFDHIAMNKIEARVGYANAKYYKDKVAKLEAGLKLLTKSDFECTRGIAREALREAQK